MFNNLSLVGSFLKRLTIGFFLAMLMTPAFSNTVAPIQHWVTQHGTSVYWVPAHSVPMLDIQVLFYAGSARDGDKAGLAQLTNAMFDEGAGHLSADQIAEKFDAVGAQYMTATDRDSGAVGLRTLSDSAFLNPALETFLTVLSDPTFPENNFNRLKKQTLVALEQDQQNPVSVAKKQFLRSLYGSHPYNHSTMGTLEGVNSITVSDVQGFYQRYYNRHNAIINMVGDISDAQAHQVAEQISERLAEGQAADALPKAELAKKTQSTHIGFPSGQTTVLMGQLGITPQDPQYFPLLVGNYILGGSGLVSRLFDEVREQRGLVYGINSQFIPLSGRGPFVVFLQTRNAKAHDAIALTDQVVQDFIAQGPKDSELTLAKQNLIGGFPLTIASNADLLSQISYIGFYGLPLDYLDTYRSRIAAVTRETVRDALQQAIQPKAFLQVTVGGGSDS